MWRWAVPSYLAYPQAIETGSKMLVKETATGTIPLTTLLKQREWTESSPSSVAENESLSSAAPNPPQNSYNTSHVPTTSDISSSNAQSDTPVIDNQALAKAIARALLQYQ